MRQGAQDAGGDPQLQKVIEQYQDDKRLKSRYRVHQLFSTAKVDYLDWILDHLLQFMPSCLLDLGCGPGYLWQHNAGRIPADLSLTLGDRSPGMLARAVDKLEAMSAPISFVRLDAERLPFFEGTFDLVLGLHVFHLLRDDHIVLREVRRILAGGGRLLVATNGEAHMRQFRGALKECGVRATYFERAPGFNLQNGEQRLMELFDSVECIHFKDALEVTQVKPLLDYARSGIPVEELVDQRESLQQLGRYWERELERSGAIRIEKETGLFIAR